VNAPAVDRRWITVVSGLPRSGTSLMMQALRDGGLPVATDAVRGADPHNPRGYLELEAVKQLPGPNAGRWVAELLGHAVKVVVPLLYELPEGFQYRVVLLRRDLAAVMASQAAMLGQQPGAAPEDDRLRQAFAHQLARAGGWAAARAGTRLRTVDYEEMLCAPEPTMQAVDDFLGGGLDTGAMAAAVRTDLCHWRASRVLDA
jgi:hypothetical protein